MVHKYRPGDRRNAILEAPGNDGSEQKKTEQESSLIHALKQKKNK